MISDLFTVGFIKAAAGAYPQHNSAGLIGHPAAANPGTGLTSTGPGSATHPALPAANSPVPVPNVPQINRGPSTYNTPQPPTSVQSAPEPAPVQPQENYATRWNAAHPNHTPISYVAPASETGNWGHDAAKQPTNPAAESQAMRQVMNTSNKGVLNTPGITSAQQIQHDPNLSAGIPRLSSTITGNTPQLPPEQETERLIQNMSRNPGLSQQLRSLSPDLTSELGSQDEGIREQGTREIMNMLQKMMTTNPEMAKQVYQQYFGQPSQ